VWLSGECFDGVGREAEGDLPSSQLNTYQEERRERGGGRKKRILMIGKKKEFGGLNKCFCSRLIIGKKEKKKGKRSE